MKTKTFHPLWDKPEEEIKILPGPYFHVIAGPCTVLPDETTHEETVKVRLEDGGVIEIAKRLLVKKEGIA
jgi:hypothetical protein